MPTSYDGERPKRPYSRWAIAAFVTGLIPILGVLTALPLGIVALIRISRSGARGAWLAITGMVVAGLWCLGLLALSTWLADPPARRDAAGVITAAGRLDLGEIRAGDCVSISGLTDPDPTQVLELTGVPCAERHNAQALFVLVFPDGRYPGEQVIQQQTRFGCASRYAGAGISGAEQFLMFPFERRWGEPGGHRAVCFITEGGKTMTGSSLH